MKMLWVGIAGMLIINNSHTFSPSFPSFSFFGAGRLIASLSYRLVRKGALQDWPLIAISHQMTVRAASLLPAERLEELLPWIQDIL